MAEQSVTISDVYTRKVSGETYQYEAQYNIGKKVDWSARIYQDSEQKGAPSGAIVENMMSGDALRQYIIAYIENIIEKGLGIEE